MTDVALGERVLVQSPALKDGVPFEANIVGVHSGGYYVIPSGSRDQKAWYVRSDEVHEIGTPERKRPKPGQVARLGGVDGPAVSVIALFSRGALIELRPSGHVMEVAELDLWVGDES